MLSATVELGTAPIRRTDILPGDEVTHDATSRTYTVRASDDTGLIHATGRISWDAPGLRKVGPELDLSAPLTEEEREQLGTLEETIRTGLHTFRAVGEALLTINNRGLYRESHRTFAEYARERWNLSAAYAYQQMRAAEVVGRLAETTETLPPNEAVARELSRAPEGEQVDVWQEALEVAGPGKLPSAAQVRDLVEARRPQPEPVVEHVSAIADIDAAGVSAERADESASASTDAAPVEQLQIPDTGAPAEHDYHGWTPGETLTWTDEGTGDVRQGIISNLWSGQLNVRPTDGKGPQLVCLSPNREDLQRFTPSAAPPPAPAPAPPSSPKPNALRSAEEIVQANAGKAVETTIGAAQLDAPVTMCMVAQDCVHWIQGDGLNVKAFLVRLKAAAYQRGQGAKELLVSLEAG